MTAILSHQVNAIIPNTQALIGMPAGSLNCTAFLTLHTLLQKRVPSVLPWVDKLYQVLISDRHQRTWWIAMHVWHARRVFTIVFAGSASSPQASHVPHLEEPCKSRLSSAAYSGSPKP